MSGKTGRNANHTGALWITAAAVGFTVNGVLAKSLAVGGIEFMQIGFARAFFAVLPLLPILISLGPSAFRTNHPWIHIGRAVAGAGAMILGFYALQHLPLANVVALGFTTPLFIIVFAVLFLGETVRWRRWTATLIGFLGVLVIVRPTSLIGSGTELAVLAALGTALGIAIAATLLKRFPEGESETVMLFYFCMTSIVLTAVPAVTTWQPPTFEQWLLLAGVGLVGVASQAMIIKAFRSGEATFVAPFDYSKLLFAAVFGYVFFGERPDAWTWVGAAIIIAATFYIARREAQLHQPVEKRLAAAASETGTVAAGTAATGEAVSRPSPPDRDRSTASPAANR